MDGLGKKVGKPIQDATEQGDASFSQTPVPRTQIEEGAATLYKWGSKSSIKSSNKTMLATILRLCVSARAGIDADEYQHMTNRVLVEEIQKWVILQLSMY